MTENQKHFDWNFLAWWMGATILGGLIGHFVTETRVFILDQGVLSSMLVSGIYSLLISTFQWILLRRRYSISGLWILAGTLGRAIGAVLGLYSNIFFWSSDTVLQMTTQTLMRGTVLGISQWLVLKQWRSKAGWWVLANAVGWTLGPLLVINFIHSTTALATILSELILTAVAGGVTGISMVWILRQPTPESNMMTPKRLFVWIMVFGALATFPWMTRLGFYIGEFWNLLATATIGALLSGFLGLVGYFIGNLFGNARAGLKIIGIIAIVIIFVLSFLMMLMPV